MADDGGEFGEPFATVAGIIGRSEEATRQVAVRARRKLRQDGRTAPAQPPTEQLRRAEAFIAALLAGDHETLFGLVAPDVVVVSDGGGLVLAARRPVAGRERVIRFLIKLTRRTPPGATFEWAWVNGRPGLVVREAGTVTTVLEVDLEGPLVTALWAYRNPDKLRAAAHPPALR